MSDCIKIQAIGREFAIGNLCNYPEDVIVPDVRVWDPDDVDQLSVDQKSEVEKQVKVHPMVAEKRYENDDVQDYQEKTWISDLGIDDHTATSFVTGLARPRFGGAWQYAVDRTEGKLGSFGRGAEVVVHCRRSVKKLDVEPIMEKLDMVCRPKVLTENGATHVVVAIEYGLEAFCLFSHQHPQSNTTADNEEAIEKMSDYAQFFADCLSNDKNRLEQHQDEEGDKEDGGNSPIPLDLQCILYSDLVGDKSGQCWTSKPVAEQYEACRKVLFSDGSSYKLVPLEVWLYPLYKLKNKTSRASIVSRMSGLKFDVPEDLVFCLQLVWDRFRRVIFETDSLMAEMDKLESVTLAASKKAMQSFKDILAKFSTVLINTLSLRAISIRRDQIEETVTSVMHMIETVEKYSPFDSKYLNIWIHRHGQLIMFLKKTIQFPSLHLVSNTQQLEKEIKIGEHAGSVAVVLHLPANLPQESESLVREMNCYADTFNPSDSSSWSQWKQDCRGSTTDTIFSDSLQFRSVGREFYDWVTTNIYDFDTVNVRYIIFYNESAAGQEPFIRLYDCRSGKRLIRKFLIPQAPGQVKVKKNHRGVITLTWTVEERNDRPSYFLQYRCVGNGEHWNSISSATDEIDINFLQPDGFYEFRVAAVTVGGKSPFGPASDEVAIDPVCVPPENLQCLSVTDTAIKISWNHRIGINETVEISFYCIECWIEGEQETTIIQRSTTEKKLTLEPLVIDTVYCIQIRAVCSKDTSGTSYYSKASSVLQIKTEREAERAAITVRRASQQLPNSLLGLDFYKLPLTKQDHATPGVGHYVFGKPSYLAMFGKRRQRTILILGATGSGKTTLINALVNYVLGVEWDDNFRFKLIDESADKSQAHSQTDLVTTYDIYETKGLCTNNRCGYSLTVVDTPGFGDTRGPNKDDMIVEQIKNYFQCSDGIRQLEAVCFVVQTSISRLTKEQHYIFESILSILGNDIKDSIRLMVTFADNDVTPVLNVVKEAEIPLFMDPISKLPLHHKFNSSIFFTSKKNDKTTNEMNQTYFEMAVDSFGGFFNDLGRMETKPLMLTREVLEERKRLEILVENLYLKTQIKLSHIDEFEQIKKKLAEVETQKTATKEFEFEVEFLVPKQTDISGTGQFTTNCKKCQMTCHFPCRQAESENKYQCSVMDSSGRCLTCKCSWKEHFNQRYRHEMVMEKVKRTSETIRQQHQIAAKETLTNEILLERIQKKIDDHEKQLMELVQETHPRIQRLSDIALRPHPISQVDYLDQVIANEKNPQKISTLQKLREKAVLKADLVRKQSQSARGGQ